MVDTQACRSSNFLQASRMQGLVAAAASGRLIVHIPRMVTREYRGYLEEEAGSQDASIIQEVIGILARPFPWTTVDIHRLGQDLEILKQQLVGNALAWFEQWLAQPGLVVDELAPEDTPRVLDRYFNGELPFEKRRDRMGFPDAFIRETALRVAAQCGGLHFVTGDGPLLRSLSGGAGITCHKDLWSLWRVAEMAALTDAVMQQIVQEWFAKQQSRLEAHVVTLIPMIVARGAVNIPPGLIPGAMGGYETASFAGPKEEISVEWRSETLKVYPGGQIAVDYLAKMKAEIIYPVSAATSEALGSPLEGGQGFARVKELCEVSVGAEAVAKIPEDKLGAAKVGELREWLKQATLGTRSVGVPHVRRRLGSPTVIR